MLHSAWWRTLCTVCSCPSTDDFHLVSPSVGHATVCASFESCRPLKPLAKMHAMRPFLPSVVEQLWQVFLNVVVFCHADVHCAPQLCHTAAMAATSTDSHDGSYDAWPNPFSRQCGRPALLSLTLPDFPGSPDSWLQRTACYKQLEAFNPKPLTDSACGQLDASRDDAKSGTNLKTLQELHLGECHTFPEFGTVR